MRDALKILGIAASVVVLCAAYVTEVIPSRAAEARRALEATGRYVDELRPAPFAGCMKNRTAFEWRAGMTNGKVCVGGWMKPKITVYR